ncbi:MAG: hypothetical protein ACREAZ_02450 [Nitrososphaera sp.]
MRIGSADLFRISLTAIVLVALMAAVAFVTVPSALGNTSGDPISAIWDAIYDLKNRDNVLQAQIDDLKVDKDSSSDPAGLASELSTKVIIENNPSAIVIQIGVINDGPDRAAGVMLTAFYKMPLLHIDSITGADCSDLGRGIVQCYLGTIEPGEESVVTMDATALESDQETSLTVDVSSTTEDRIPSNNHNVVDFITTAEGMAEEDENEKRTDDLAETNSTNLQESDDGTQDDQNKEENQRQESTGSNQTSSESASEDASNSEDDENEDATGGSESGDQTTSESSSSNDSSDEGEEDDESESQTGTGSNQTSSTGQGG